jgi:hypothetical protein
MLDEWRKGEIFPADDKGSWMRSFLMGLLRHHTEAHKADGGMWLTDGELYVRFNPSNGDLIASWGKVEFFNGRIGMNGKEAYERYDDDPLWWDGVIKLCERYGV